MLSKSDIKLIKSLAFKKYRRIHKLFLIEGERLVSEAVQSKIIITQVYLTDQFIAKPQHDPLMDLIAEQAIITNSISEKELAGICDTVSPSGILALCKPPDSLKINIYNSENWLYLDEIQDPNNLGTLLRSADWFGIKNVALSKNCIDIYNPKVLRGGMGVHFRLSIHENILLNKFKENQHTIIGAIQKGDSIYDVDRKKVTPWILVIGNEAHGINKNNINHINLTVTIPKFGSGESLNAAVAGSILLYHLTNPI
ncbi:MAG: RNA methyltransferase [Candidatus Neomarinimicrobiota bacterium]